MRRRFSFRIAHFGGALALRPATVAAWIEAAKSPQPIVAIDAHASARYERVAGVLATARNAGIEGVGFDDPR